MEISNAHYQLMSFPIVENIGINNEALNEGLSLLWIALHVRPISCWKRHTFLYVLGLETVFTKAFLAFSEAARTNFVDHPQYLSDGLVFLIHTSHE